ncbi:hypothetical protein ACOQFV_24065 [Nocardiopsis changdeensis]|uniref:Uncharacterized protein n=1 Tax=Nocardiopsis changdeensis TaxID=2831969 RepID=A0A975QCC1_9ACTN|nr:MULTISPECIES: hypothetical protein [Nocardiopsis]QUX26529.1 hypothetical protein KGD84_33055 [Nocardiopsis changdeensis]QYX40648.1 hypothetical protein K1J57_32125 [Nocardiopsis sp. MT53]
MALAALIISLLSLLISGIALYPQLTQHRRDADRRHDELTPHVHVAVRRQDGDRAVLEVTVTGPRSLERLDTLQVRLEDDHPRSPVVAGGPTQEDLDAQLWGPYQLSQGDGRTVELTDVAVRQLYALRLTATPPPPWAVPAHWRQDQNSAPLIVTVQCRSGRTSWTPLRREHVHPR